MTFFPTLPTLNDTFWKGESLYQFDGDSWNKTMDLTPLHHWRLNDIDNGSLTASDSGTNPINGVITDCILSQTGQISRNMEFTGSSSYIEVSSDTVVDNNFNTTWSAWVNTTQTTQYVGIIAKGALALENGFGLIMYSGTSLFQSRTGETIVEATGPSIWDAGWTHLVGVRDNDNSETKIYYNGDRYKTVSGVLSATTIAPKLIIGGRDSNGILFNFNGNIEDVRIYDRALTQQEISAIYSKGQGTYSHSLVKGYPTFKAPIHHWKLQETTGTTVNDSGSEAIAGVNSDALINKLGKIDSSYEFTGTASYVDCGTQILNYQTSGTFCFWLRLTEDGATAGQPWLMTSIIIKGTTYEAIGIPAGNKLRYYYYNTSATPTYFDSNYTLSLDKWVYASIAWNASGTSMYFDGEFDSSNTKTWADVHAGHANTEVNIGRSQVPSFLSGNLEDVRIYDYALSDQEIKNIYNLGKGTHQ